MAHTYVYVFLTHRSSCIPIVWDSDAVLGWDGWISIKGTKILIAWAPVALSHHQRLQRVSYLPSLLNLSQTLHRMEVMSSRFQVPDIGIKSISWEKQTLEAHSSPFLSPSCDSDSGSTP